MVPTITVRDVIAGTTVGRVPDESRVMIVGTVPRGAAGRIGSVRAGAVATTAGTGAATADAGTTGPGATTGGATATVGATGAPTATVAAVAPTTAARVAPADTQGDSGIATATGDVPAAPEAGAGVGRTGGATIIR